MVRPDPGERVAFFAILLCIGSLLALYGLPLLGAASPPFWPTGAGFLLLQTAPLLACVPALLRGNPTGVMALALLALVYFGLGTWTLMNPATRLSGTAEVGFALGLFFASATWLRARGRRVARETAASGEGLAEQDS